MENRKTTLRIHATRGDIGFRTGFRLADRCRVLPLRSSRLIFYFECVGAEACVREPDSSTRFSSERWIRGRTTTQRSLTDRNRFSAASAIHFSQLRSTSYQHTLKNISSRSCFAAPARYGNRSRHLLGSRSCCRTVKTPRTLRSPFFRQLASAVQLDHYQRNRVWQGTPQRTETANLPPFNR